MTFFRRPALASITGSLTVAATMAGHSVNDVAINVVWDRLGFSGVLSAEVETMRPEPIELSIVTIADWRAPERVGSR